MKQSIIRLVASAATASCLAAPVAAYPIDCAILLCMAGGFPASAECSAAKAEVIRRITPWPVEPPLQLWRCPMGSAGSPGSVPPEVAGYRDGIEIWEIRKYVSTGSGGRDIYVTAMQGTYSPSGVYIRRKANEDTLPAWVNALISNKTGSSLGNEYGPGFRAILLRMPGHDGRATTEWVSY